MRATGCGLSAGVAVPERSGRSGGGHAQAVPTGLIGGLRGRDLRAARESAGVSLDKLAGWIGRSKGHLSRIEREIDDRR